MAVKIRLMRVGKKKQPAYRVVVADGRSPRDGRFIEVIGRYEPRQDPSLVEIDGAKALDWLLKGARPTQAVANLLKISGVADEFSARRPGKKLRKDRPARDPESKRSKDAKRAGSRVVAVEPELASEDSAPVKEHAGVVAGVDESGPEVSGAAEVAGSEQGEA